MNQHDDFCMHQRVEQEPKVPAIADVIRSIPDQSASKPSLNTVSEPAS